MFDLIGIPGYCGGSYLHMNVNKSVPQNIQDFMFGRGSLDRFIPEKWMQGMKGINKQKVTRTISVANRSEAEEFGSTTTLEDLEFFDKFLSSNGIDYWPYVKGIAGAVVKTLYPGQLDTIWNVVTTALVEEQGYVGTKSSTPEHYRIPTIIFSKSLRDQCEEIDRGERAIGSIQSSAWLMYFLYLLGKDTSRYYYTSDGSTRYFSSVCTNDPNMEKLIPWMYNQHNRMPVLLNWDYKQLINRNYPHYANMLVLSQGPCVS